MVAVISGGSDEWRWLLVVVVIVDLAIEVAVIGDGNSGDSN